MKLNVTVFLLKNGRKRGEVLSNVSNLNHTVLKVNGVDADFYWKKNSSQPRWVKIFEGVEGIESDRMRTIGLQGLLVFETQNRVFCYTFGNARHLLDQLSIERYFGLKVALSLTDPELIKSIDKTNIDKLPLRSRAQSSKYVSISEFEFKFDWEILKSITGVVEKEGTEDYELVSGSDSVSLYTDFTLNAIEKLSGRLLSAYNDESYKVNFPWIDYIVPVRDRKLVEQLDENIVDHINAKDYEDVWASPPEIIEYGNFSGFCYRKRSGINSQVISPDLDLESCLRAKKMEGKCELGWLKSTQVFIYSSDNQVLSSWPLYLCLNGELMIDGKLHLLSEGSWYQIDAGFCDQIEKYFREFPPASIRLPNYRGMLEGVYLSEVSKEKNLHLMDRKLVKAKGASSSIEFCDLITSENDMIHVKKYSSSSVLSHLFSQAYVSAETLLRAPEIQEQINSHLKGTGFNFNFDPKRHPRVCKIILAIMQKKPGKIHMPFFSKVNFKQYSQRLQDMGYIVELLKINI